MRAYEALSPDPVVLEYRDDLKWVVGFIQLAAPVMEKEPAPDLSGASAKIWELLDEHLDVTGLRTVVKLRHITDLIKATVVGVVRRIQVFGEAMKRCSGAFRKRWPDVP